MYHGTYSIYSIKSLNEEIFFLKLEKNKLEKERILLEKKVFDLKDNKIKKDLLDEHIRNNINFSLTNELTILLPQ